MAGLTFLWPAGDAQLLTLWLAGLLGQHHGKQSAALRQYLYIYCSALQSPEEALHLIRHCTKSFIRGCTFALDMTGVRQLNVTQLNPQNIYSGGAKNTFVFAWGACWLLIPYASVSVKTLCKFRFDVFSVVSQNLDIMCQGQKTLTRVQT